MGRTTITFRTSSIPDLEHIRSRFRSIFRTSNPTSWRREINEQSFGQRSDNVRTTFGQRSDNVRTHLNFSAVSTPNRLPSEDLKCVGKREGPTVSFQHLLNILYENRAPTFRWLWGLKAGAFGADNHHLPNIFDPGLRAYSIPVPQHLPDLKSDILAPRNQRTKFRTTFGQRSDNFRTTFGQRSDTSQFLGRFNSESTSV